MGGTPLASSDEMRKRVISEPGPFDFRIERDGRIRHVEVELMDEPQSATENLQAP